ncbi:MAG: hypothetical protein U0W40_05675 [Acidimicrobiia bacterium]
MPTDPFVAPTLDDAPRNEPNLAPGVHLPASRPWTADRPGDLTGGQPTGTLLGRPGPNVGFAMTLAHRARERMALGSHEPADDAVAVVAELAMKRASSYGRGPTTGDVDLAMTILGYQGECDASFADWRAHAVHGAHHEYGPRRRLVDAVPEDALRTPPTGADLASLRTSVRAAFDGQ